jgi:hypothetical protein
MLAAITLLECDTALASEVIAMAGVIAYIAKAAPKRRVGDTEGLENIDLRSLRKTVWLD